ncbi:MAG: inosine/xanthosine triphosphatase [Chloroflexi bacterium]|nr:inosine/xanthosine triphosphatase [Chloroflexota bacterium]
MMYIARIAIGSTNPVKCNASQRVLSALYPQAEFIPISVESNVRDMPIGDEETRLGAVNRAQAAMQAVHADMGIGLEGGVQETEFGMMTCAWCAIVDLDGRIGVGGSSCIRLPDTVANLVRNGIELGMAMDQLTGQHNTKQAEGAIGILTNGLSSRQEAYEALIRMALAPFLRPAWYS